MRYRQIFIAFLLGVFSLSSCNRENLYRDGEEEIVEGLETNIRLQFPTEGMGVVTRAVSPVKTEAEINSLAIYIFDKDGILLSSAMHDNIKPHVVDGVLGEGNAYVPIPAITGNDRKVYAIANYNKNHIENLKNIATEDDLKSIVVTVLGNPLLREFGMVKVGMLDKVDIRLEQVAPIKIPIYYLSAKITVKVINKSTDLEIDGWGIDGVAMKEYLLERSVTSNPNYHDATDIYNSDDYYSDFGDQSIAFDEQPQTPIYGNDVNPPEYKIEFYLLENRRGVKTIAEKSTPPDGWPHGTPDGVPDDRAGKNAYKMKSWEAPEHATRFRIVGMHKRDGAPKLIIINHYLGENNVDDYNVCRATHYTYTITVNSLDNIDIDTNIEQAPNYVFVRNPPDLASIDAHASFRMFTLHTERVINDGKVDIEVLNSVNSTTGDFPTWVKISPLMTNIHQVKTSDAHISRWQEEGDEGSYIRPKFIPHKSKRGSGYTPPSGINIIADNGDGTPNLKGQNPDLAPFGSDYPNNDDILPYFWSFRRMCSKITDIPTNKNGGITNALNIFVYTDEFPYNDNVMSAQYREAVVRITYTINGKSEYEHYAIRQYAPIRFTGLPEDGNNIMVVERMEEYAHMLQTSLPLDRQFISGMQWGDYNVATTSDNGYKNTVNQIYSTVNETSGTYTWDKYLPKYGSMTSVWITEDGKGTITEPVVGPFKGAPYYNFNAATTGYYNATYNSTAARYCHEKNFDENGDGKLSQAETHWYLPSQQELQLFWTYREIVDVSSDYYWSSTASTTDPSKAYAVAMTTSRSDPHRYYNGVQQLLDKVNAKTAMPPRVKCVRRVTGTPLRPMVKHQIDGTTLVDCSNMPGDFYTNTSKMGGTQQDVNLLQKMNNQVFKKFLVQKNESSTISYSALHQNGGMCKESQGWRLPTQREMLLIWSLKKPLEAGKGFEKFTDGKYWTMTRGITNQYVIEFKTGLATYENLIKSELLSYRCIKEVQ